MITATFSGSSGENYSLSGIGYDANGNLQTMTRADIDNLTYSYSALSNKLTSVSDATSNTLGFADGNTTGNDYDYWPDGSLKKDLNRGISLIEYNHLKLPRRISKTNSTTISYQYDANGQKLRMSSSGGDVRDYVGPFQYLNSTLFEVAHEEGRYTPATGYEYFLHDHLGNVRAVVGSAGINQYTDYDPWGLALWGSLSGGLSGVPPSTNRMKFNGKEAIGEVGNDLYDFGAKLQDAAIGRWGVVDPLAELFTSESGYSYAGNNPVRMIDPTGMSYQENYQASADPSFSNGYANLDPSQTTGGVSFFQGALGNLGDLSGGDPAGKGNDNLSKRRVAAGLPVNMAMGMGAYTGLKETGQFLTSLVTTEGWRNLGQGISDLVKVSSPLDVEGMIMRAKMAETVNDYVGNIPNMTAGEAAFDVGYVGEKVAEAVLTRKVMPVSKASLGLRRGFGEAARNTNMISYALKGKMGRLPFSVPTIMPKIGSRTSDVGIMLSRNFITPFGYGIGIGQLQYVQKGK